MTSLARGRSSLIMLAVAALSFGLLVYVGWSEGRRTYPRFQAEKMVAQGELVQTALDTYLRAGLPLAQFPGFRQIAEPLLGSDPSIAVIAVRDPAGRLVFAAGDAGVPALNGTAWDGSRFQRRENAEWLQVALPLRNRFEFVGELSIATPRRLIAETVNAFLPAQAAFAACLSLLYAGFAFRLAKHRKNDPAAGQSWLAGAYTVLFALAAVAMVAGLLALYSDGAQSKARALANSLGQRLEPVLAYGLAVGDFEGLDRELARYRQFNPDIQAVAITQAGRILVHSDPLEIGRPWQKAAGAYDFIVPVGDGSQGQPDDIRVAVSLPAEVVWRAVLHSVKNFAALFIASALMAALFLGVARAQESEGATEQAQRRLVLIRPVFFMAIFCENLTAGFLPQLLRHSAVQSGFGDGAASAAFAAYFIAFLLALLPVSAWVERSGPRPAVIWGALLAALGCLVPVLTLDFRALLAARALAGIAQGLLFIGMQAALLAGMPPAQRTRAAAIIVFGFNGGMIAGAAIGSLLVNDVTALGVFGIGCVTALLLAGYAASVLEPLRMRNAAAVTLQRLIRDIPRAFASLGFLRAFLLIGAPAKAILTGAVSFLLPLLLAGIGWSAEDIGQIIMVYAAGVLLSSGRIARFVDISGRSGLTLAAGGIGSAFGLAAIGLPSLLPFGPVLQALFIVAGTALLGLAHGCINAPIITYIAGTSAAETLGANGATALYRVIERAGHVLGPMLAAQLLLATGRNLTVFLWIGAGILVCTLLFVLTQRQTKAE